MSSQSQRLVRMKRELELLEKDPPAGISAWPVDLDSPFTELRASMLGPQDSPFAGGVFQLAITVPERYPFEPPKVRFITPVYHPNIDSAGRICLDTLKMPPQGSWAPCINLSTMLTTVQLLLSNPNPDDALMADISNEFRRDPKTYFKKAQDWTKMHAMQDSTSRHSEVNGVQTDKVSLIPSLSSLKRFPGLSSQKLQTEIGRIEKPRADEEKEKPVKLSEVKKGKKPLKTHDSNDSSTSSSDEEDDQENEHAQRMRKKFKLI